jgi:hypothetical protein
MPKREKKIIDCRRFMEQCLILCMEKQSTLEKMSHFRDEIFIQTRKSHQPNRA